MPYERNSVEKIDRREELICFKELEEDFIENNISARTFMVNGRLKGT